MLRELSRIFLRLRQHNSAYTPVAASTNAPKLREASKQMSLEGRPDMPQWPPLLGVEERGVQTPHSAFNAPKRNSGGSRPTADLKPKARAPVKLPPVDMKGEHDRSTSLPSARSGKKQSQRIDAPKLQSHKKVARDSSFQQEVVDAPRLRRKGDKDGFPALRGGTPQEFRAYDRSTARARDTGAEMLTRRGKQQQTEGDSKGRDQWRVGPKWRGWETKGRDKVGVRPGAEATEARGKTETRGRRGTGHEEWHEESSKKRRQGYADAPVHSRKVYAARGSGIAYGKSERVQPPAKGAAWDSNRVPWSQKREGDAQGKQGGGSAVRRARATDQRPWWTSAGENNGDEIGRINEGAAASRSEFLGRGQRANRGDINSATSIERSSGLRRVGWASRDNHGGATGQDVNTYIDTDVRSAVPADKGWGLHGQEAQGQASARQDYGYQDIAFADLDSRPRRGGRGGGGGGGGRQRSSQSIKGRSQGTQWRRR